MLAALSPLLEARARGGYVRHCHGDLHLRNIVEIDGAPVLFDAIEFDDKLATIDVLYDLAFLLMDLGKRGLRAHANAVLNAYLEARGPHGQSASGSLRCRCFCRCGRRSGPRSSCCARASRPAPKPRRRAARGHAPISRLAQDFLAPSRAASRRHRWIVGKRQIGGGAGDRAFARRLSRRGHIRSDVERKRLFGVEPEARLPARAYAPEMSDQVYAMCRKRAMMALLGGPGGDRRCGAREAGGARGAGGARAPDWACPFTGLWLEAPAKVMRERVASAHGRCLRRDAVRRRRATRLRSRAAELHGDRCKPPARGGRGRCLKRIGARNR